MRTKFTIISAILTIIIVLPALFFSGYEVTRMNSYEKELENIYKKQLDAILFSINQYSEDIIGSWIFKMNFEQNLDLDCMSFKELFSNASQIRSVILTDTKTKETILACANDKAENLNETTGQVKNLLRDSIKKVTRLIRYAKAGYHKNEPLGINTAYPSLFIVFLVTQETNKNLACVIEIDAERFIKELLGNKIQSTVEDKFNVNIVNSKTNKLIYPSQSLKGNQNKNLAGFQIKKPLWLFPQYLMGIQLKGKTLDVLSKERTRLNLIMIILVDVIFIIGALMVFRNLRKEMKLTLIKSEFISNVSHEIRTPLALISMYIETLEMDRIKSEEKKKEYYQVIYSETQRLSGLVNKILNFSKIESGKRKYTFQKSNLNDIVGNIMQSYKFHLKSKGFELGVYLDTQELLINADKEALADSIVNLIDNAVKYSKDKKYVEIKTGIKASNCFVEVTDKGIGIAREDHKLIFDKFYRVSKGDNVYEVKGTGLGLTIVKSIVDAHKGKIEVESKPGEGSTFRILLPMDNHS